MEGLVEELGWVMRFSVLCTYGVLYWDIHRMRWMGARYMAGSVKGYRSKESDV